LGARPGGKDLLGKNQEAASISWTGRANHPIPPGRCSLRVGATARSPNQPAAFCGSRSKPPKRGPTRPMLFAQKLLAPGPQPKHPGNINPATGGIPGRARGLPFLSLPGGKGMHRGPEGPGLNLPKPFCLASASFYDFTPNQKNARCIAGN
jgi:hypothetical protein